MKLILNCKKTVNFFAKSKGSVLLAESAGHLRMIYARYMVFVPNRHHIVTRK